MAWIQAAALIVGLLAMAFMTLRQERRIKKDRDVCRQTREMTKQSDSGELQTLPFRKTQQRNAHQS